MVACRISDMCGFGPMAIGKRREQESQALEKHFAKPKVDTFTVTQGWGSSPILFATI
jgi:hypothetical protein